MAYKNQKKNKAHISELGKDPTNWRKRKRAQRLSLKRSAGENDRRRIIDRAFYVD